MALIIDGYNLLHASGILGRGVGPGSLERSRLALLGFLAESLDERQRRVTTIVFDAREAPPGLPRLLEHRELSVRYAPRGSDADSEIEELIKANSSPRKLTVVSSDHRLHRAARRRGATAIDSDQWFVQTLRARIARLQTRDLGGLRRTEPATADEVQFWLRQFGFDAQSVPPVSADTSSSADIASDPTGQAHNPFPPGYADDITEENA